MLLNCLSTVTFINDTNFWLKDGTMNVGGPLNRIQWSVHETSKLNLCVIMDPTFKSSVKAYTI